MKRIELKEVVYQIFDVDDDVNVDDVGRMYEEGTLLIDNPHTSHVYVQFIDDSKPDESYVNIF